MEGCSLAASGTVCGYSQAQVSVPGCARPLKIRSVSLCLRISGYDSSGGLPDWSAKFFTVAGKNGAGELARSLLLGTAVV